MGSDIQKENVDNMGLLKRRFFQHGENVYIEFLSNPLFWLCQPGGF
jgi:hypothetical protein